MRSDRWRSAGAALGIFLVVGAVYGALGAGRIDIIDGQYRFEVARNLLTEHSIQVQDPSLPAVVKGLGGRMYSPYGLSGSVVSLPLLMLARISGPTSIDRQQFFFSFTSAAFGAATAALLFLFYIALGVVRRTAMWWALAAALATLALPAATSVFDQSQHAFFVLAACYLAVAAARRDSVLLAACAGGSLAILLNFQVSDALFIPTLGIATLAAKDAPATGRRRGLQRYAILIGVASLGVLAWASLNKIRFGSFVVSGIAAGPSPFGNPLVGLAGLFFSEGKSIFLYSPLTALAIVGTYKLVRTERQLGLAIVMACAAYVAFIASLSFYGGDWCWGPRYFVVILPLVSLGLPMVALKTRSDRGAATAIIVASVAIQLLGVSVDQHRFFYARSLPDFFWAFDRGQYFRDSALFARPGELLTTVKDGVPQEASRFRPGPYPELVTYAIFGPGRNEVLSPPDWMRSFRVFWLPRPWPLWMSRIPTAQRPVNIRMGIIFILAAGAVGASAIRIGVHTA